jgi:hypothetical protein
MPAPAALHLLHGWWIASCPDCGFELSRRRDQEAAERTGQRRRCPICRPTPASRPSYRGLRLDGPPAEFHRAVDRLSWDTVPTPLGQPPTSPPAPPRRRHRQQVDGQVHLLDPSDREESA